MQNSWVNWGVDWLGSLEERMVSCMVGGRVVSHWRRWCGAVWFVWKYVIRINGEVVLM
jgi:hypothetical protein